jgi:hypothetical protein
VYYPEEVPTEQRPEYAALLAIPLSLGDLIPEPTSQSSEEQQIPVAPEELIGIFTIATDAPDNKLLTLTGPSGGVVNDLQKHELVAELWAIAVQYLRGIGEAVRNAAAAG